MIFTDLMKIFDPYITFRVLLALLFFGYLMFDLIAMVVFYQQLPRFVQRVILLKLLQLRSRSLKVEIVSILLLFSFEGWLLFHLITGEN